MKKEEQTLIEDSMILGAMEQGTWYKTSDIAELLGVPTLQIYKQVSVLEKHGKLNVDRYGHNKRVQLRPVTSIAGPAYMPALKPLTGYDPGALMRMCNASRKADTGMA